MALDPEVEKHQKRADVGAEFQRHEARIRDLETRIARYIADVYGGPKTEHIGISVATSLGVSRSVLAEEFRRVRRSPAEGGA